MKKDWVKYLERQRGHLPNVPDYDGNLGPDSYSPLSHKLISGIHFVLKDWRTYHPPSQLNWHAKNAQCGIPCQPFREASVQVRALGEEKESTDDGADGDTGNGAL